MVYRRVMLSVLSMKLDRSSEVVAVLRWRKVGRCHVKVTQAPYFRELKCRWMTRLVRLADVELSPTPHGDLHMEQKQCPWYL